MTHPRNASGLGPWCAAREEAAQIATQLLTGGYDGTEGEDGSSDTTWTDFGIVCGIADRLAEALERLTVACEARVELNAEPPTRPDEHERWVAVIVEHVNATEAARLALGAAVSQEPPS